MGKRAKAVSLEELKDKIVGKKGTSAREQYEFELQLD